MKTTIIGSILVLVIGLFFSSLTFAVENGPGCGVGKQLFKGKKGLVPHSSAWTTNGTFSQSFAVTSGTSGCDADSVILKEKELEVFVVVNFDNIQQEMAQSRGQYLNSLAALLGCSVSVRPEFNRMTFEKFDLLSQANGNDYNIFIRTLTNEINNNHILSSKCESV